MQDFKGSTRAISMFSTTCKVGTGFFPEIPSKEATYVTYSCNNPHDFNNITCQSHNRQAFVNEVEGLKLNIPLISKISKIPNYIPILDSNTSNLKSIPDQYPVIGIRLKSIVSATSTNAGGFSEIKRIRFHSSQFEDLTKNKKLILFLTGSDTLIEYIWRERNDCGLFKFLREMNCMAVTGFNFSLFEGECAFSQILNQKRSLYSSYLLEQNGINTIPHVYALTPFQITRWIEWFQANPRIEYFTVNCQLQKSNADLNKIRNTIITILKAIPRLHVIIQGFPFDIISSFGTAIGRIHFVDTNPLYRANNHKQIDVDINNNKTITKVDKEFLPLLIHNLAVQKTQIDLQIINANK